MSQEGRFQSRRFATFYAEGVSQHSPASRERTLGITDERSIYAEGVTHGAASV